MGDQLKGVVRRKIQPWRQLLRLVSQIPTTRRGSIAEVAPTGRERGLTAAPPILPSRRTNHSGYRCLQAEAGGPLGAAGASGT